MFKEILILSLLPFKNPKILIYQYYFIKILILASLSNYNLSQIDNFMTYQITSNCVIYLSHLVAFQ